MKYRLKHTYIWSAYKLTMFFQQILFHHTAYPKYESFLCWDIKEEDMFTSLLTLHLIHFHFSSILCSTFTWWEAPSAVYTSIPSSDKAVPQNKDCNITRWPKILISIGILWDHHHTQSITDQNVAMSYITSFISVLPWTGGHWHWREGSHISLFFAWHCEDFVTIPKINTTLSWSHNYFVIEKAY